MAITIPTYRQGDPAWGSDRLGVSVHTLSQMGCTVTSLAMALANYGIMITPKDLNQRLTALGGFMPNGNIIWAKIEELFSQMRFIERVDTCLSSGNRFGRLEMPIAMARIRRLVDLGQPVLTLLSLPGFSHWVVIHKSDFTMNDPADGRTHKLLDKYGPPEKLIEGYSVIIGPPWYFPEDGDRRSGMAVWKLSQAIKGNHTDLYLKEAFEHLIR